MMVNIMASTQIATSIVTEKSSRVIEFLLISIKPLALMIGKILAMLTAVLVQVVSLIIVVFLSNKLSSAFSSGNSGAGLSQLLPADIFNNLNPINILFCLLVVVLGMTFYAALAGLTGATVSRLEEMNEGLTLFTFVNMAGAYIGIAANVLTGPGVNGYVILNVIPLSSPFLLPCNSDRKGRPLIAGAVVLQLIFIMLLFRFVARVYEAVILHNGSRIKFNELFKLYKSGSERYTMSRSFTGRSFRGWTNVFGFTFRQNASKGYKAVTILVAMLIMGGLILAITLTAKPEDEQQASGLSPVKTLYVLDETGQEPVDFQQAAHNTGAIDLINIEFISKPGTGREELIKEAAAHSSETIALIISENSSDIGWRQLFLIIQAYRSSRLSSFWTHWQPYTEQTPGRIRDVPGAAEFNTNTDLCSNL